jgi:RNA polymerase sigma factor for flagellar operon FliA
MNRRGNEPVRDRLVELTASAMATRLGGRRHFDELYDLGVFGLVSARREWDGRGQFEPFAMERIRWAMLDGLRQRRRDALGMARVAAELAAQQHARRPQEVYAAGDGSQQIAEQNIDEIIEAAAANYAIDLDTAVEHEAERMRIRRAISDLPPPQDQIFDRYYYEGQTFEEVADALGMKVTTVFELHVKGVQKLTRQFGRATGAPGKPPGAG